MRHHHINELWFVAAPPVMPTKRSALEPTIGFCASSVVRDESATRIDEEMAVLEEAPMLSLQWSCIRLGHPARTSVLF